MFFIQNIATKNILFFEGLMQFIHSRELLNQHDIVVVDCSHPGNVLLTDDTNFSKLKNRLRFSYLGGHVTHFPTEVIIPKTGYWNLSIDFADKNVDVKYSITIIKYNEVNN